MCQMNVVVEKNGDEELLLENVTNLEVAPGHVTVSTLFEGQRTLEEFTISSIDFMAGKVYLRPSV